MNQILKDSVYGKGTMRQIDFIAELGGMNAEEYRLFVLAHEGKSDNVIRDSMCLSRKAYDRLEASVRAKVAIAVFECINYRLNHPY